MEEKLAISLAKSKFKFFEKYARKNIYCEDEAYTSIKYDYEVEPKLTIEFNDYCTTESDFRAMLETLIEECERNLDEEETKKIITKLVKELLE